VAGHFSSDSDEGSAGGLVEAVFGELFSFVWHTNLYKNKVSKTLSTVNRICLQIKKIRRNLFSSNDLQMCVKVRV